MRLQTPHAFAKLLLASLGVAVAGGCKSDLNQQLLERELRYQEDQIYYLQDELAEKKARLDHVASENVSLRRQLGVGATDNPAPSRGGRLLAPRVAPATTVPPAIEVPDASPLPPPRNGPPVDLTPPSLEGVPALPAEPVVPSRARGISFPPAAAVIDPAARPIEAAAEERAPALVRAGFEESVVGDPVRLVIKPLGDAAGRGGISFAVEPRDSSERLVPGLASDLVVTAFDAALPPGAPPIASWTIPGTEVQSRFRPTGRHRGIAVDLPWQGTFPSGDHVRLRAEATTATGPITSEALVPVR
jgi:hypothetical protein